MRGMPRVVTLRTWVSPRWNSPEPCAVGMSPTRADRGLMSRGPGRRSVRPSSTIRWRTSFLVSERTAAEISFSRPGEFRRKLVDEGARRLFHGRFALGLQRNGGHFAYAVGPRAPGPARRPRRRSRGVGWKAIGGREPALSLSSNWRSIDSLIQVLEASRPSAMTSSVTLGAPWL